VGNKGLNHRFCINDHGTKIPDLYYEILISLLMERFPGSQWSEYKRRSCRKKNFSYSPRIHRVVHM